MPAGVRARLAFDADCSLGEYRGRMEERAVMLAAIEAMAEADAIRASCRDEADIAAQATAREPVHGHLLWIESGWNSAANDGRSTGLVLAIPRARNAWACARRSPQSTMRLRTA